MSDRGTYRATYAVMIDSPEFRQLSPDARLVLHTLKNSRINNMAGIFIFGHGEEITISEQSGISLSRVLKAIDSLCDTQWIANRKGILWVRNQLKYTPGVSLANPKHKIAVEKIIKSLGKSEISANFCKYYDLTYPFDTQSDGYTIPNRMGIRYKDTDTEKETEKEKEKEKEKRKEYLPNLKSLKIEESYFDKLCKEFPTVDHQEELKCADLYREGKPGKGKRNDHLFLRNWFKNSIKFKEGNDGKGKPELNKYDNL